MYENSLGLVFQAMDECTQKVFLRLEYFDKTQILKSKGRENISSQKVSTFYDKGRRSCQCMD